MTTKEQIAKFPVAPSCFLEDCNSIREARRRAPWGVAFAKVPFGYLAFKYVSDWQTWKRQK